MSRPAMRLALLAAVAAAAACAGEPTAPRGPRAPSLDETPAACDTTQSTTCKSPYINPNV